MPREKNLAEFAGLPLWLDPASGRLRGDDSVYLPEPGVRRLGELRNVLFDPGAAEADPERTAYLLYRGVHRVPNGALAAAHGIRYDLTVTLPGMFGPEYPKTAGHYHVRAPDGLGYPELYEVLNGCAMFILQRVREPSAPNPVIHQAIAVTCKAGDRIVIPPDCGHVTVNVGPVPLVVSDLVADTCTNDYGSFASRGGASLLVLKGDDGRAEIVPNRRYEKVPAPDLRQGTHVGTLLPDAPLATVVDRHPERLAFLTRPGPDKDALDAVWGDPDRR